MKIAFTSCTRYAAFKKQPEWDQIAREDPDYLFLLGDNIYMDYGVPLLNKEPNGTPKEYSNEQFRAIMESKYYQQFELVPEFKALVEKMKSKNGFYAIWDDHDFAWNDAKGADVPEEIKAISQELFHKHLDCSTNLPHVYYHVDTPLARVIFIDNRTDAEEDGSNSKMISDAQFEFIEEKLNHTFPYTILCSGLTITKGGENWCKYPSQLQRLCRLIENKNKVIFLAGDIHTNAFVQPKQMNELGIATPVQLISSGMQIDYLGFRGFLDARHNWAMLEMEEESIKVSFFNKWGLQKKLSRKANRWFAENFLKKPSLDT